MKSTHYIPPVSETAPFRMKRSLIIAIALVLATILVAILSSRAKAQNGFSFIRSAILPQTQDSTMTKEVPVQEVNKSSTDSVTTANETPNSTANDGNNNSSVSVQISNDGTQATPDSSVKNQSTTITSKNSEGMDITTNGDAKVKSNPSNGTTTIEGNNYSIKVQSDTNVPDSGNKDSNTSQSVKINSDSSSTMRTTSRVRIHNSN